MRCIGADENDCVRGGIGWSVMSESTTGMSGATSRYVAVTVRPRIGTFAASGFVIRKTARRTMSRAESR